MKRRIAAARGLDTDADRAALSIDIDGDLISHVGSADGLVEDVVVLPALINAHDHARSIRPSSIGGFGKPLEIWLNRLALLCPIDPYLAALAPLARAALGGQGAVMIHYTRPMGLTDLPTEAAEIARAASDVGVRIAFGVALRDQNPLVYGAADAVLDDLDPVM